jgi:hypothetical protein
MRCYLWLVLSYLDILRFEVTTDRTPTHLDSETWVLIKEFTL